MTTITPTLRTGASARLSPAAPSLWRVIDADGRVIGHVQARADRRGTRFRARRYHPPTRAFRDLGDFWSADDAVDCLRYSR